MVKNEPPEVDLEELQNWEGTVVADEGSNWVGKGGVEIVGETVLVDAVVVADAAVDNSDRNLDFEGNSDNAGDRGREGHGRQEEKKRKVDSETMEELQVVEHQLELSKGDSNRKKRRGKG